MRYGRRVAFIGIDGKDANGSASAFLHRFPVTYPSYTDPHESIAQAFQAATYYPQTLFFDRTGHAQYVYDHAGPYESAERARARHPALRPEMTEALTYEVRRAGGESEMAAVLELRHEVFCEEQGVPEREELDGRDRESLHLVAVADDEVLATCRLLFVGPTVQFSRLAVRIGRPPPRDRHCAAEAGRRRGSRRRRAPARPPRPDLRPRPVRQRRVLAPRADLHGGGDRAHRDGEAPLRPAVRPGRRLSRCPRSASTR